MSAILPSLNMSLHKEIIVIGDIELGAGNLTDGFIADRKLSSLILELSKKKHPVDLVLNGDTFDFLKCPSQLQPHTKYPRHITQEISLAKLALIYNAHKDVFEAWKKFASSKNKFMYFILGNHDHDLVYPEVQQEIRTLLGNQKSVKFPGLRYTEHGVYVEHGQQYDFIFKVNFEKLFINYEGQSILNLPFISFGLISRFMRLNEENPFIERIFPRPALLTHYKIITKKINYYTISYFIKSLLYYPFRFYADPTYTFPTNFLREFYRRIRTAHWDVDNITNIFMKNRQIKKEIIVLGHIHEKRIVKGRKRVIIHPGSWRDEYDFNPLTRELVPRTKRYVDIKIIDDKPQYKIVDLPQERTIFYFDEVIKDELKFIKLAAKEEGYAGSST